MKTTKNFLVSICLAMIVSMGLANTKPDLKKTETVQIQNYLEKLEFNKFLKNETKVEINFMINKTNEIIIISTNNLELDEIIKSGLNYKSIDVSNLEYNKEYTLPVHVIVKN
jgi:hypothetical protein